MKSEDYVLMRMIYPQKSFGLTGNLTHDLIHYCKQKAASIFVIDDQGGYSPAGHQARNYLFGGSDEGINTMVEIMLRKADLDGFKADILKMLENGKDNAAFYILDVEGYMFKSNA